VVRSSPSAAQSFVGPDRLKAYVPELVIEWLRETPRLRHRRIDGSLVFVDISGFTSLTERLSKKGKVGAEEMNDLLDGLFAQLLPVAYDYGGNVVKWGGDAILLLFADERHEARACVAAAEMQQTIRSAGRLKTSSGQVVLRMSVGIHSGALDFFLVGDLHRELLITGPAASATVEMEAAAAAGEITISSATAAAINARCLGEPRGAGFLLRRGPDVPPGQRAPTVDDLGDLDLRRCLSAEIGEHVAGGGGEAEHRPMTAAFIQFMRADDLLAGEGPEALADALERCLGIVQHAAHDHRVAFFETDIAQNGGKIMLMAGAPRSAGNNEERMLRAMRAVLDADSPLPLRIGVSCGRIFVGNFGPEYRRTYSVKGDAVNLAARLMTRAEPGQLLATDEVLTRSRTEFQAEAIEPFHAKGKAEPVRAFSVGPVSGTRHQSGDTPLIGRDSELRALVDALARARNGTGTVVDIVAEPGMGKSRLLSELRSLATDELVVSVQCDEYETSTPYFSVRALLTQLLELAPDSDVAARRLAEVVGAVAPELTPWLPLIAVPLGLELDDTPETAVLEEQFRRARVTETTVRLLAAVLATPTVLVFEDTHWMDEASSEVLRELLLLTGERPWLAAVARRTQAAGFAPSGDEVLLLELQPLAVGSASELLHSASEDLILLPHEIEALSARASGNPLFLTQLVSAARAAGGIAALPDSLEAVMMAEIDRLQPADRRVLRCAAVVGASVEPELVAAALDEPLDADVWARLSQYLEPHDGDVAVRFRHALVRDAAYEGLPFRRRRELHERVGLALERRAAEAEAELLSLHFYSAGDHGRAWRYSRVAGERAQELYANAEAATFFQRALEAARHLHDANGLDVRKVQERLGDVRVRLGELTQAAATYRAARQGLDGDLVEEARLLVKEAMIPFRLARYPAAMRWLNRASRVLDGVHGPEADVERVRISVWCANTRQRQGRKEDAIAWCERALEGAAKTSADTRHAVAHAYVILDWAYFWLGRPDEAVYSPKALDIFEELGDLEWASIVLNNMGVLLYIQGRWDEALELERRALEAEETFGDRWGAALTAANIADILADQGRLDEAEPLAMVAYRVYRATGISTDAAAGKSLLGRIAARSGRFEEARASFEEARTLYLESGQPAEALRAEAGIAECFVLEGEAEAAILQIDEIVARASATDDLAVLESTLCRLRGCALLRLGRLDEARVELEEALRIVPQDDADFGMKSAAYEAALILDALVQLGRVSGLAPLAEVAVARDEVVERLGVVQLPELALPGLSGQSAIGARV
jgi:class 3 adenylate cyclase/tetratricopeptide (TPR) repeat protein